MPNPDNGLILILNNNLLVMEICTICRSCPSYSFFVFVIDRIISLSFPFSFSHFLYSSLITKIGNSGEAPIFGKLYLILRYPGIISSETELSLLLSWGFGSQLNGIQKQKLRLPRETAVQTSLVHANVVPVTDKQQRRTLEMYIASCLGNVDEPQTQTLPLFHLYLSDSLYQ